MDFLNRAWKQNIRKPMKSLMIFLVMFVISNLIVTGIFILKGTESATNATMSKITPIVYYTQDWDRYYRAMDLGFIDWETDPMPPISIDDAKQIAASDAVKTYDLSTSGYVMAPGIKAYKDPNNSMNEGSSGGIMMSRDGNEATEEFVQPDQFEIIGTSSSEFKLASGTLEIADGRGILEDDITSESNVIMIEERLAKANNLSIGDKVGIDFNVIWDPSTQTTSEDTEHDYEIIGIYRNLGTQTENDPWMNERVASQIYMPYNVVQNQNFEVYKISLKDGVEQGYYTQEEADQYLEDYSQNGTSTIGYLLNDPLTVRDFIEDS
ncbi:MAG: ABC transporter permease, partial [Turicibacter sp.]